MRKGYSRDEHVHGADDLSRTLEGRSDFGVLSHTHIVECKAGEGPKKGIQAAQSLLTPSFDCPEHEFGADN
jgi:hypothetical protein